MCINLSRFNNTLVLYVIGKSKNYISIIIHYAEFIRRQIYGKPLIDVIPPYFIEEKKQTRRRLLSWFNIFGCEGISLV